MSERIVDDGFGNTWVCCNDPRCDLEVVRPGKVQCSDYCLDENVVSVLCTGLDGSVIKRFMRRCSLRFVGKEK